LSPKKRSASWQNREWTQRAFQLLQAAPDCLNPRESKIVQTFHAIEAHIHALIAFLPTRWCLCRLDQNGASCRRIDHYCGL